MKRLIIPQPKQAEICYPADVERIIAVCSARGYQIDALTAQWAWCEHSENYAAGWLFLPKDDDQLFYEVFLQLDTENEDD